MRAEELIDEDDWIEVEKAGKAAPVLADVTVKIAYGAPGRFKGAPKARTSITFRGPAAQWIEAHGPRFRVEVGGRMANYVRIVPDVNRGKFEVFDFARGSAKGIKIGVLNAWPSEDRTATEATWTIEGGFMKLRLPENFAVAAPASKASAPAAAPAPARAEPKVVKSLADLGPLRSAGINPARSSSVVAMVGEPDPGRSALARRG